MKKILLAILFLTLAGSASARDLIMDNFTRGTDGSINGHTPDVSVYGDAWSDTQAASSWYLYAAAPGYLKNGSPYRPIYACELSLNSPNFPIVYNVWFARVSGGSPDFGFVIRKDGANGYLIHIPTTTSMKITKITNYAQADAASNTIPTITNGAYNCVQIIDTGVSIEVRYDGNSNTPTTHVLFAATTDYNDKIKIGPYASNSGECGLFDGISITDQDVPTATPTFTATYTTTPTVTPTYTATPTVTMTPRPTGWSPINSLHPSTVWGTFRVAGIPVTKNLMDCYSAYQGATVTVWDIMNGEAKYKTTSINGWVDASSDTLTAINIYEQKPGSTYKMTCDRNGGFPQLAFNGPGGYAALSITAGKYLQSNTLVTDTINSQNAAFSTRVKFFGPAHYTNDIIGLPKTWTGKYTDFMIGRGVVSTYADSFWVWATDGADRWVQTELDSSLPLIVAVSQHTNGILFSDVNYVHNESLYACGNIILEVPATNVWIIGDEAGTTLNPVNIYWQYQDTYNSALSDTQTAALQGYLLNPELEITSSPTPTVTATITPTITPTPSVTKTKRKKTFNQSYWWGW